MTEGAGDVGDMDEFDELAAFGDGKDGAGFSVADLRPELGTGIAGAEDVVEDEGDAGDGVSAVVVGEEVVESLLAKSTSKIIGLN